ncbi:Dut dUTPase [uncultured Caudovirales phage]|uniref:dUTP diphosphatase n=1 Tax=uncultured Caudovirales phage TaxID=2100421 RepID=A0A6J5KME5_9CAUD|nr:Dut dUTPase [uncultured Caudovirales phage]
MKIKIKKLHPEAIIPKYATDGAACFDLHAVNPPDEMAMHGLPTVVPTGLSFEIPHGFVMLIFSRSGHGFKHDTRLANCVGVIDSDYRGEVMVKLTRDYGNNTHLTIKEGDRIAQAMVLPIPVVELVEADELTETERGAGGFGSTGVA